LVFIDDLDANSRLKDEQAAMKGVSEVQTAFPTDGLVARGA
jgi:hypothetical protein